jgi:FlaG/FlaF family flagellin (archaellin)
MQDRPLRILACPIPVKPALSILVGAVLVFLSICTSQAQAATPTPACTSQNLIAGKAPAQQRDVTGNPALVTNEIVVLDGASWDGPAGIRLEGSAGSLTYDLGKPTRVSAFVLQADANDSYRITGSQSGEPGTFTLIAQAGNAVERGHGMRTRAIQIEPVTVRFLRVGEADGDNAFSISEFAAYCAAPTPFPPAMKSTEAPMAAVAAHSTAN